jgi:hypothetical protein
LDKPGGFVNGAIGTVEHVLGQFVYIVKLQSGNMVLLHPIVDEGGPPFLPCTYGYAMTIRRAQGATLDIVVLYFDLKSRNRHHHVEEGYAYVGSSRVRRAGDLYIFGRTRRTDWLPVVDRSRYDPVTGDLQTVKGVDSMSENSEDRDERELHEGQLSSDEAEPEGNYGDESDDERYNICNESEVASSVVDYEDDDLDDEETIKR